MAPSKQSLIGSAVLVLLGLIAYWPGLAGGFLFDDFPNLVLDPDWKVTALEWAQWRRAMSHGVASDGGRGLALLSFAINHYFTGLDPWPLKLTNLLMHAGNSVLVLLLCKRLFGLARGFGPAPGQLAAWAIAAAWLLHPLQVSTVLYVVQRMEIGAQGFTLLALMFYLTARERQCAGRRGWPWLVASAAAMLLGLGFKESALLVPVFAGLIELTLLGFKNHEGGTSRAWKGFYLTLLLAGTAVFLTVLLPHYLKPEAYLGRDFSLLERLLTQPRMLCIYLGQMLWPNPEGLLFYYDHVRHSTGLFQPLSTLWSLLAMSLLVVIALAARRRRPLVSLGIAWFFAAHFLTSNIVPLELAFEHRNYLALFGILLAIGGGLAGAMRSWERASQQAVLVLPVLTLAGLTVLQTLTWSTPLGLATTLASRNPASPRASYDLGTEWLALSQGDPAHPLWSLAYEEFGNAASLPYGSGLGEQGQILMLGQAHRSIAPELWQKLRRRLDGTGTTAEQEGMLHSLAECRIRGICAFDDAELQLTLMQAVSDHPDSAVFRVQYSNFAFNVMRDPGLAIALIREAIALDPQNPTYKAGLVKLLLASNLHGTEEVEREIATLRTMNVNGELNSELAEIEALRRQTIEPGLPPVEGN